VKPAERLIEDLLRVRVFLWWRWKVGATRALRTVTPRVWAGRYAAICVIIRWHRDTFVPWSVARRLAPPRESSSSFDCAAFCSSQNSHGIGPVALGYRAVLSTDLLTSSQRVPPSVEARSPESPLQEIQQGRG